MYVARRVLKVVDKAGKVFNYHPGDVIPDFADWDEVPRRAHLNMEFVEEVRKSLPAAPTRVKFAPHVESKGKKKKAATAAP